MSDENNKLEPVRKKAKNCKKTPEERDKVIDLLSMGVSIVEVEKRTGITRQTIHYWKRTSNLDEEVKYRRNEYVSTSVARVIPKLDQVVDSLVDLALNGKSEQTKLNASKYLLGYMTEFSNIQQQKTNLNVNIKADATQAANIAKENGFNLDELLNDNIVDTEFEVKDDDDE